MATILLTGFDAFGGAAANSSWDAVQLAARDWPESSALVTACLPVQFGRAGDILDDLIGRLRPDLVIATGVAAGRTKVTPERIAINLADARIPDNAGAEPRDEPIVAEGPDAYFTRLPVQDMVERMTAAGIPAALSLSAGTYVCNDTMYRMLHSLSSQTTLAGFIHVPDSAELPVASSAAALRLALESGLAALG
ncbi:MAG: pyroglutamyl-peptidase I [Cryobacterium sp.]|nr:pyroglutamyl-peptidase I [Cryobacterium sp.]